ncbi:right-handed parallel beta-helix repeat-containing protein [Isoptericola croceus]|uniref:right-handed parallel beta-helix repeat-containing protein n=1 Tax=Isoptericola croceus TaxID=3031406 RepID=UPI0023F7879A|nr:right-handed parallel beta-helix repeat-containing protein [Isoptericola croceus]
MTATISEITVQPGEPVQQVLNECAPGAVVRLAAGEHQGSLSVTTAGVSLVGAGAGATVIVPGDVADTDIPALHDAPPGVVSGIAVHRAADVSITGLTIRGFSGAGIYAHSVTGLDLTDVEVVDNAVWGLYLRESSGLAVTRCRGEGSQYAGVATAFCATADAVIQDCTLTGNAYGVFIDNSSRAQVIGNRCRGNAAGIMLLHQVYEGELPGGVQDVLVADNDCSANELAAGGDDPQALGASGPPISGVGIAAIGVQRMTMVGNRLHANRPGGPSVMGASFVLASSADWGGSDSSDNDILWNTITGSEPYDMQLGTDPTAQRFRNNIVGASQPETVEGCAPPEGS